MVSSVAADGLAPALDICWSTAVWSCILERLTHKHLETHGCVISAVATDDLVL